MLFTGEYEHTIDAKNRLAVPADIRQRLDPERDGEAFYLVLAENRILWLYPDKYFERLVETLDQPVLGDQNLLEYEQLTFPLTRRLELDSTGRIRLPDSLLQRASLSQQVTIIGVRDHLEIRDTQQWRIDLEKRLANQSAIWMAARAKLAKRERDREG
ncbi:MAG: hypothetical protein KAS72_06040 [Phycisphaerales bacterium]|nr:hypothetical protein [Phycisphaerales bacterium]